MTIVRGPRGAKAASGYTDDAGHVVVVRDDSSESTVSNVLFVAGTIVDNGDGSCTLTLPEE